VPRAYFAIVVDHPTPTLLTSCPMRRWTASSSPRRRRPPQIRRIIPPRSRDRRGPAEVLQRLGRDVPVALLQLSSAARRTPSRLMQVLERSSKSGPRRHPPWKPPSPSRTAWKGWSLACRRGHRPSVCGSSPLARRGGTALHHPAHDLVAPRRSAP
jgi:hypothetical protein